MNLFFIFFIENELFRDDIKKEVWGNEPNVRTVQPTQLIEAESCALQNYREFFFSFYF